MPRMDCLGCPRWVGPLAASASIVWVLACVPVWTCAGPAEPTEAPFLKGQFIFPHEAWHNHASCVVECPNGDLLACWYHGSGERSADDVRVEGARLHAGATAWGPRGTLADTPGFPDTNPCLFIDARQRLWLFWQVILANKWESALIRYQWSTDYQKDELPRWDKEATLFLKPGPEFLETVQTEADRVRQHMKMPALVQAASLDLYLTHIQNLAKEKLSTRLGWMTRAHPVTITHQGKPRIVLPLYSDGFNFSLFAWSDDDGTTWHASRPAFSLGGVQPSVAVRRDGTLVAYLRDNGLAPKRLQMTQSTDGGATWSTAVDTDVPNPGSGAEVITLRNGDWVLIHNDTERGRHQLAVALSDDEGKSWKWKRHLETNPAGPDASHFGYPSIIQARDGTLHATYTHTRNGKNVEKDEHGKPRRECIKHVHFNVAWIKAG